MGRKGYRARTKWVMNGGNGHWRCRGTRSIKMTLELSPTWRLRTQVGGRPHVRLALLLSWDPGGGQGKTIGQEMKPHRKARCGSLRASKGQQKISERAGARAAHLLKSGGNLLRRGRARQRQASSAGSIESHEEDDEDISNSKDRLGQVTPAARHGTVGVRDWGSGS